MACVHKCYVLNVVFAFIFTPSPLKLITCNHHLSILQVENWAVSSLPPGCSVLPRCCCCHVLKPSFSSSLLTVLLQVLRGRPSWSFPFAQTNVFFTFLSLYLEFLLVKCSKIFTAHRILYNTNFIHKKIGFVKAVSLIFAAAAAAKKVLLIS